MQQPLPNKLLIENVHLFDPSQKLDGEGNLLIENGVIRGANDEKPSGFDGEIIDGKGAILMPGLFDMHVHLREPGREDKETIVTGSNAAANGGFTGIACMPNTSPAIDTQEVVQYIKDRAEGGLVDVMPVGAITKERAGQELAPIAELVEAGAVALSDDGSPVMNAELMRRALEYSKMFDVAVLGHEEDECLSKNRVMHEGFHSTRLGLPGIPSLSEEVMVARDIMLTEYTGGRFHVCHISTAGSIELVRRAKENGLPVTCEVTPHHFTLTDKAVDNFSTNSKMNPPLRTEEDLQAIIDGLKDGTIDAIATDHAPHTIEEKEAEYIYAPFGITGLESAFGLIVRELLKKSVLNLEQIYHACISNPRKILKISVPRLKSGTTANLSLLDIDTEWRFRQGNTRSKSINSPFYGEQLIGRPLLVINNGSIFRTI